MRVLVHSHFFRPSIGGCETAAELLAHGLAEIGHEVRVLTETPSAPEPERQSPFQVLRNLNRRQAVTQLRWCEVLLSNGPGLRYLPDCVAERKPFVLVFQGPHAACPTALGWRNGARCSYAAAKCLRCDVFGQGPLRNLRHLARYAALRYFVARSAANVFISEFLLERSRESGAIPRAAVIANPYDDGLFDANRAGGFEPAAPGSVIFVGRLVDIKGVDLLLDAYAHAVRNGLKRRLRVVGDGPLLSKLKQQAERCGVGARVSWCGVVQGRALAEEYRAAAVVAIPSVWEEPFGIVTVEAMGSGTPVLVSDHGALAEVAGRKGWCVRGTVEDWSRALLSARDLSTEERSALSDDTRSRFGRMNCARRYTQLLREVIGK